MNLKLINLNLLKTFEVTYRLSSMTGASKELFMTQSAVSQNIRQLEEALRIKLFDRIKKKIIPTHQARELYQLCIPVLRELEQGLDQILGKTYSEISGHVSLGLPVEYGNNVVLPILSRLGQEHPDLGFSIRYGHANEMNAALLRGELDFAIVDSFGMDKRIGQIRVGTEKLALCCSKNYVQKISPVQNRLKFYQKLDYIDYVADAPVLKQWFRHHFKEVNPDLNIRASLMNVQGMGRMICAGLGVGILPMHVIQRLIDQGESLYIFRPEARPLENHLSLAFLEGKTRTFAVEATMNSLIEHVN